MADNVLTYKGYSTRVNYSAEDHVLYGKIEGIADLVNFQCEAAEEAEQAFHEAVDDYLAFCQDIGKEPDKEYRGSFNVRIQPSLHRDVDRAAMKQGISMNQYIERALMKAVEQEKTRVPFQLASISQGLENDSLRKAWSELMGSDSKVVDISKYRSRDQREVL